MKNKAVLYMVLGAMAIVLAGATLFYWYKGANYVDTDDARVDGAIIKVSPQIAGKIAEIYVGEGDRVQAGAIIARQVDFTLAPGANLDLAVIRSPVSGTVIKKVGHAGEVGVPGQPVAMVADLENLYITANVKETRLHKVRPGQQVDFTVDGVPGVKFSGRVDSIGDATVSAFSLFPLQNTGGSYTKVVQRVPVKISIDNYQGQRLLPGMNAQVRIHVG